MGLPASSASPRRPHITVISPPVQVGHDVVVRDACAATRGGCSTARSRSGGPARGVVAEHRVRYRVLQDRPAADDFLQESHVPGVLDVEVDQADDLLLIDRVPRPPRLPRDRLESEVLGDVNGQEVFDVGSRGAGVIQGEDLPVAAEVPEVIADASAVDAPRRVVRGAARTPRRPIGSSTGGRATGCRTDQERGCSTATGAACRTARPADRHRRCASPPTPVRCGGDLAARRLGFSEVPIANARYSFDRTDGGRVIEPVPSGQAMP